MIKIIYALLHEVKEKNIFMFILLNTNAIFGTVKI